MKIIAFGHRKRVGKDTAAKFLLSHLRMNFSHFKTQRLSFGDQLKDISYRMFAWGGLQPATYYFNHPEEIEKILPVLGKSPRNIWDEMGLTGRNIHPKVWTEMAVSTCDCDLAVSPDLRFPTEIDLTRRFGGMTIRIDRPAQERVHSAVDTAIDEDGDWDAVIINDGTLKDLHRKVLEVTESFLETI